MEMIQLWTLPAHSSLALLQAVIILITCIKARPENNKGTKNWDKVIQQGEKV